MDRRIIEFGRSLQDQPVGPNVNNFYAAGRTNAKRHNLQLYLQYVYEHNPHILFVGEAPGHNGCARTGIPFSSEQLLCRGVHDGRVFGRENGYIVSEEKAVNEQTAAAMWNVLHEYHMPPLLWNAFPFHPYKKGNCESNRKPTRKEMKLGSRYLLELMELFAVKRVVAVGNSAEEALRHLGIGHVKVRHPSYGGRRTFREQMDLILNGL